jgi:hypothetical protein
MMTACRARNIIMCQQTGSKSLLKQMLFFIMLAKHVHSAVTPKTETTYPYAQSYLLLYQWD